MRTESAKALEDNHRDAHTDKTNDQQKGNEDDSGQKIGPVEGQNQNLEADHDK